MTDEVNSASMRQGVERAQALYRAHVKDDQSSEAFLEARRAEAEREQSKDEDES